MTDATAPIVDSPARPVSPHPVMVTITVLMVIGVVMVYSSLCSMEHPDESAAWYKLTSVRSMIFAPAAFLVMLAFSRFPYRVLDGRLGWALLIGCVVLLVLVYVPGIGVERNFRRRWVKLPGLPDELNLGFQPSEIAKFAMVVFLAWWLGRRNAVPDSFFKGFLPAAAAVGVVAGIVAKEDLGTGLIIAGVGFSMLLVGGCKWWHPLTLIPVIVVIVLLVLDETRLNRLLRHGLFGMGDPTRQVDLLGKDYQVEMSKRAIAGGGVMGQGLGEGYQKLGFLPLRSSDFIFAHITEELGLVGSALILVFYGVLLFQGGLIMTRARDGFGQLIAFGITLIFGFQAFVHSGVVVKLLPNKGINLPFISAGGTGMIIMAAAGGLLAAVARATRPPEPEPIVEPTPVPEDVPDPLDQRWTVADGR